jgi:hypothetical protein
MERPYYRQKIAAWSYVLLNGAKSSIRVRVHWFHPERDEFTVGIGHFAS